MEFKSNIPIYLQVIQDIERKMLTGELPLGSKLPSSRELALQYQINPNTAARVYNEMELMEISFTKRGIGTFVTEDEARIKRIKQELVSERFVEFVESIADLGITSEELQNMVREYYEKREGK